MHGVRRRVQRRRGKAGYLLPAPEGVPVEPAAVDRAEVREAAGPAVQLPHRRYVGDGDSPKRAVHPSRPEVHDRGARGAGRGARSAPRPRRSERCGKRRRAEAKRRRRQSRKPPAALHAEAPDPRSAATSASPRSLDGLPEVKHEVSFKGRPVTHVVLTIDVPPGIDPQNVKVCAVTEGATIDVPGRKPARVASLRRRRRRRDVRVRREPGEAARDVRGAVRAARPARQETRGARRAPRRARHAQRRVPGRLTSEDV